MIHVLTQSIVYSMCMQFLHFKPCLVYTYEHNDLTLYNLLHAPYPTVVMRTMERPITAYGPQQYWSDQPNSNNLLRQPTLPTYSTNLNLVASALLSAGDLREKGYTDLIAPKYLLVGDRLMSYQFYNIPTTKINISLHILEDTSWKSWYRKQH